MAQDGSSGTATKSGLTADEWADFNASSEHFKVLFPQLENDHWGRFVAISADGQFALGGNHKEAVANFERDHGKQRVTTFYIGIR